MKYVLDLKDYVTAHGLEMEVIESERNRFIPNAIKNGYTEEVASKVYDLIVKSLLTFLF